MTCFGCGPANRRGLQLRSFEAETGTLADFTPWPEHDNGLGFLNGGIICTILDCHSATPVLLEAERIGLVSGKALLPFVTAGLEVEYLRPTPLTQTSQLRAVLSAANDSTMQVQVELWSDGKVRAEGTATWRRWRQH